MTLPPLSSHLIGGVKGDAYKVSQRCVVPDCRRYTEHPHHMWPRSWLKVDYEWVRLPSGNVIGNRVGLCVPHHRAVTGDVGGYTARVRLDPSEILWWEERAVDQPWRGVGPLDPQPPKAGEGQTERGEAETCPTCGHVTKREHSHEPREPRPTRTWTVTVPADAELGADVLTHWVDDLALVLGAEHWTSRLKRYHVLTLVLAWASQHRSELLSEIEESARV